MNLIDGYNGNMKKLSDSLVPIISLVDI